MSNRYNSHSLSMDAATSSTCLDLTISLPGSSSARNLNLKPLQVPSRRPKPDDINWINIGFPSNSSEDTEVIDSDSPRRDETTGRGSDDPPTRKKLRLYKEQSQVLEDSFRKNHTLSPSQKEELADRLKLRPRQVEVWFQNRRARSKLKQTEVECEYLKRWFGSLTEQNRKLQKEVEELRAMKVGPITCEPGPATSITMCPRCERVNTNVDRPNYGPNSTAAMLDKARQRNTSTAF